MTYVSRLSLLSVAFSVCAFADAIALHAPVWCYASVDLTVIGGTYSHSTGVDIPQCVSPLTTIAGALGSTATGAASTSGIWGTSATALAALGGTAPPSDHFVTPVTIQPGLAGNADLTTTVTRAGDTLTISGSTTHNANGFLELAVLYLPGLTLPDQQALATGIFLTYGSVEKALAASFISTSQVLLREREGTLSSGAFTRSVPVDAISDDDIVVTSLATSASEPIPEPTSLLLVVAPLAALAGKRLRRS